MWSTSIARPTVAFVSTGRAPAAIGTYSQAVRAGDTVYVSGQIALDPASGRLIEGDIGAEIRRVLENHGLEVDQPHAKTA